MSFFDLFKKKEVQPVATNGGESGPVNQEQPSGKPQASEGVTTSGQSDSSASPAANNGKAHIYNLIIIDESGSMGHLVGSTVSGVNETINTIRQAQQEFADKQDHFLSIVTFDSPGRHNVPIRTLIDMKPIGEVEDFKDYHPCGCTPLYDAMGQSIMRLYQTIKDDADASAIVTVLTDGLENASREYRGHQLKELIEKLKEEGWTFSYMGSAHDVKSVTDLLSIDNVVDFSHDNTGAKNTWERERSARMGHFRKMNLDWEDMKGMSISMKKSHLATMAKDYYHNRVTPRNVETLHSNEVFVFGSDPEGRHNGGAARYAVEHFGAVIGQGKGLQGQSYAIPSTVPLRELAHHVCEFINYAEQHPEQRFIVTAIGCGTAGHDPAKVAQLFEDCIHLENVTLPLAFWKYLGISMMADF